MSATKHTPGPWDLFVLASPAGVSYRVIREGGDDAPAIDIAHIPAVWSGDGSNAALIAAAPELADALEAPKSCDRCRCSFGGLCEKHRNQRDAALRKAGRLP